MELQRDEIGLASLLKSSTQEIHAQVEGEEFIKKIFTGQFTANEYWLYLWSLHQVYSHLEKILTLNKNNPAIEKIFFSSLWRVNALEFDLESWEKGQSHIPEAVSRAVESYCQHLTNLANTNPELLVSHAYVRYLGDLSGGQMIAKSLRRKFPTEKGFSFYDFPEVTDVKEFKQDYRQALDAVGVMYSDKTTVFCEEAQRAFTFNGKIFAALEGRGLK